MSLLDEKAGLLWDSIMRLDGTSLTYTHDGIAHSLLASVDDITEVAEVYYAILKSVKEIVAVVIRRSDLPFLPSKGDTFIFDGNRYIVFQIAGKDYFEYADASRKAVRVAGYRDGN